MFHNSLFNLVLWYHSRRGTHLTYWTGIDLFAQVCALVALPSYWSRFIWDLSCFESCITFCCSSQESAFVALPWHSSQFVWDLTCFCIFHRYTSSTFLQCFTNICWSPPVSRFVVASRGVSPGFRWVALLASLVVLTLLTHFPVCATPAPPPQVMSKQC